MKRIILASKSPRRIELFAAYGICADSIPADVDETIPGHIKAPCEIVKYLSEKKALHVLEKTLDDAIVIAADTLVFCDDIILGKPADKKDAKDMMKLLSGRGHSVITGLCIASKEKKVTESVMTEVFFRELSDSEIEGYISTDDPYDKAGGYGIQSIAGLFVREIKGDYYNVVGLPISRLAQILRDEFSYDVPGMLFQKKRSVKCR